MKRSKSSCDDFIAKHTPCVLLIRLDFCLNKNIVIDFYCYFSSGQNKNKFVIAYFAWRVITGLHLQITYLMQEVGHTRCLIDAGFARAKKLFRRTDCDSIAELKQVFDHSSSTNKGAMGKTLSLGNTTIGKTS